MFEIDFDKACVFAYPTRNSDFSSLHSLTNRFSFKTNFQRPVALRSTFSHILLRRNQYLPLGVLIRVHIVHLIAPNLVYRDRKKANSYTHTQREERKKNLGLQNVLTEITTF